MKSLPEIIVAGASAVDWSKTAVNGVRMLKALAVVESSFGLNNIPRHEDSWCRNMSGLRVVRVMTNGSFTTIQRGAANVNAIVRQRHEKWGCAACCSWSPWQIHYQTAADRGFGSAPWMLMDAEIALDFVSLELNRIIAGPSPSETVEQIADAWNSGNYRDRIVPADYIAKVRAAYRAATP